MATIRVTSSPASTCKVFKETIVGSGAYNIVGDFIPTTIEFDLNLDTLIISNISVVNLGTVIDYNYDDNRRKTYISADFDNFKFEYARTGNITYGYGATPYYNGFDTGRYLGGMFNTRRYDIDYLYLAAYYNIEANVTWIIPLCKLKDSDDYGFDVYKIVYDADNPYGPSESEVASLKKWVLDVFYGGLIYTELVLISPDSTRLELNVGDSIQLKWGIELSNGVVVPYNSVEYTSSQALYYTVSDNLITLIEMPPFPPIIITVTANIDDLELKAQLSIGLKGPYYPNGSSRPSGGGGYYGNGYSEYPTANKIPVGTTEANDSATGMYTRYLVDIGMLSTMANWLWSEELGLQIAKAVISLIYGDPIQTVISCVSYPFQLNELVGEVGTTLHWGGHDTEISMSRTAKNAFQINWGSITVKEHWGNFLDYSPHTQMQLYLPWGTGFVPIDPNDILNTDGAFKGTGTLSIVTNVEISRGMCVHHVIANNTVIGSYSGACGRQIAMVGNDYASKQVALAGSAIGAMAAATLTGAKALSQSRNVEVSKNPNGQFIGYEHGGVKRMQDKKGNYHDKSTGRFTTKPEQIRYDVKTGKDAINKAELQKLAAKASAPAIACAAAAGFSPANVVRSGSFQEGTGGMTIQSPYLIISIPKMDLPDNYGHYYGYPSNITFKIGSLSGYTEVASIHLDGFNCTMSELDEIESLLTGGVII